MENRDILNSLLTPVLGLWLVVIVAWFGFVNWQEHSQRKQAVIRNIPEWRDLLKDRKASLGAMGAPIVIIEFSDYQCPFCRALEPRLQKLVSVHPGDIVIYRYALPLAGIHPFANEAAKAADCAAMQGVTEAYQSQLFNRQAEFGEFKWSELAMQTGVKNVEAFKKCVDGNASTSRINRDLERGKALKIFKVPTLIINGTLIDDAVSDRDLERLYDDAIKSVSSQNFIQSRYCPILKQLTGSWSSTSWEPPGFAGGYLLDGDRQRV